jgi:putative FmdB family regulatory protein
MPMFEYRCEDCGTSFEKLVRNSDTAGPECPSCGTAHVAKQLSVFAAVSAGPRRDPAPMGGGCAAGMCRTPDVCGRN